MMKRIRDLMNVTSWGWIVALGMVPALIVGCGPTTGDKPKADAPLQLRDPLLYEDRGTGCQYLATANEYALTPRIAADGKTHIGCKAGRP